MKRSLLVTALCASLFAFPAMAAGGEKGDFEIGLYSGLGLPDSYGRGVAIPNPDDDALYGLRFGYFFTPTVSLELSGQQLASTTQYDPLLAIPDVDFDIDSVRLNLLHNFRPGARFRPFLTFGIGTESAQLQSGFDETDFGYNAGAGFRVFLTDIFALRLDGRFVSSEVGGAVGGRQDNVEGTFGLAFAFGGSAPGDADGDGVVDRRDRCPNTPRGAVVDKNGCPTDADGDGVWDGLDKCPKTATGVPVDAKGCPKDSDGDGVHDGDDACPGTPKGAKVDAKGCPKDADGDGVADGIDTCPGTPKGATVDAKGCPKDSDGDGVWDGLDTCPSTPKGATVDAKGCPKDSDNDGVWDGLDKCPGTPRGTKVDSKGCKALFEDSRKTLVLEGVRFEFNSAVLTTGAKAILDRVALSLNEWRDINVEVGGHTDSKGSDSYNLSLSAKRADAVEAYLESKGVSGSRITTRGYGENRPIADNGTEDGRSRNRRVELSKR